MVGGRGDDEMISKPRREEEGRRKEEEKEGTRSLPASLQFAVKSELKTRGQRLNVETLRDQL